MTAPEVRAEISPTRRVDPPPDAIPATVPRPAGKKSQALADDAATEIRRLRAVKLDLLAQIEGIDDEIGTLKGQMRQAGVAYNE